MVRDLLLYAAFTDNLFQLLAHRPVVDFPEHGFVSRTILVAFDYLHGNIKQFHLERDIGLVPLADYPFLAVHFHDFIRSQFLHVHKTKGGEAGENEKVTHQCECGIFKLVCHDGLYLVLRQILPFLHIRADVELRKRVSRYQSVIVRPHYHAFQPHAVEPYRGVLQPPFGCKISRKLLDEVGCQFEHRHIRALVERLDESRHIVSRTHHYLVCADGTVFAHTFEEVGAILVKRPDTRLILATDSLIGVAHHFRRHECLTVGKFLVVLDDLRLDVVKGKVDVPCPLALAFRPVPFHVPKCFRDALLATELRHSPVDCHPSHDGDNAVLLLAAVHVEQHFEYTSCHTRLFFDCKIKYQRVRPCKPNIATRRKCQCHVLKIAFRRVMI